MSDVLSLLAQATAEHPAMRQAIREEIAAVVAEAKAARQAGGAPSPAPSAVAAPAPVGGPPPDAVTVCLGCGGAKRRHEFSDQIDWARGICTTCRSRGRSPINEAAPGAGEPLTPEWQAVRDRIPQITADVWRCGGAALQARLTAAFEAYDHHEILAVALIVAGLRKDGST